MMMRAGVMFAWTIPESPKGRDGSKGVWRELFTRARGAGANARVNNSRHTEFRFVRARILFGRLFMSKRLDRIEA